MIVVILAKQLASARTKAEAHHSYFMSASAYRAEVFAECATVNKWEAGDILTNYDDNSRHDDIKAGYAAACHHERRLARWLMEAEDGYFSQELLTYLCSLSLRKLQAWCR